MSAPEVPKPSPLWPIAAAIGFNLIPIAGVLFWGWSAFALVFLYWFENVVIGVRTLANIAANAMTSGVNPAAGFALGAFFTVHYGLFCTVHGVFVFAMFGGEGGLAESANYGWGILSIVLWQIVLFVLFVVSGEPRRAKPMELMFAPYPRIVVLHIAIIGGGWLVMAMGEPLAGLVMLTLLKTGFDVAEALGRPVRFGSRDVELTVGPWRWRPPQD